MHRQRSPWKDLKKDTGHLPQVQALALFHICQEALANIAKHAHARKVKVTLWNSSDRLLLEVRDDGRGFDQTAYPHDPGTWPGQYQHPRKKCQRGC